MIGISALTISNGSAIGAVYSVRPRRLPPIPAAFYRLIYDDDRHLVFGSEEPVLDREYRLRSTDGRLMWVHERGTAEFHNEKLVSQRGLLRVIDKQAESVLAYEKQGRDSLYQLPRAQHHALRK